MDETQMLLALRSRMGRAYFTFPDPDDPDQQVTMLLLQENRAGYQATFQNGRPHVKVRLLIEGELLAAPGGTNYLDPAARERLGRAVADNAEQTIRGLLTKTQGWGADPSGFGHLFRRYFLSTADWFAYDWRSHLQDLQVETTVEVRFRRYGLIKGSDRLNGGM